MNVRVTASLPDGTKIAEWESDNKGRLRLEEDSEPWVASFSSARPDGSFRNPHEALAYAVSLKEDVTVMENPGGFFYVIRAFDVERRARELGWKRLISVTMHPTIFVYAPE